jgi:hypothetical protein
VVIDNGAGMSLVVMLVPSASEEDVVCEIQVDPLADQAFGLNAVQSLRQETDDVVLSVECGGNQLEKVLDVAKLDPLAVVTFPLQREVRW